MHIQFNLVKRGLLHIKVMMYATIVLTVVVLLTT